MSLGISGALILASVFSFVHAETTHLPYKGLCAPGFAALDNICVLDDRCGPGAYAGKVCTIDGVTKPYLKPLQQGHAGISAANVICAEGLELVFRSDNGSPACVKSSSVAKLKERGWQEEKPVLACTLEYNPVCGVDGITYGNMCAIGAEHIAVKHAGECSVMETSGVFEDAIKYTQSPAEIDPEKGYFVTEIADGIYWLVGSGYQTMFVTTGEGVIAVDAPQPIGEKYVDAITETTDEPITHMIYSHYHQDHVGVAGQIFPDGITYIGHQETTNVLERENDPNRPAPNITFDDTYTLTVGDKTLEMYYIGNYHSGGDILILVPDQKVAMLVDLLRPGITPYMAFARTPDIDQYLQTHDTLQELDFDVLISGHTNLLATKEHINTNKQFTLDVMENAKTALDTPDSDPVETCANLTIEQWTGRLANLDEFMADHCTAMIDYLSE